MKEPKEYKWKWLTFYPHFREPAFTYSPYSYFSPIPEIHFCLFWGEVFLKLPFLKWGKGDECEYPAYGVYWHSSSLWIRRGKESTVIYAPWNMEHQRTSTLIEVTKRGEKWLHERKGQMMPHMNGWYEFIQKARWNETHPYTYKLKSGQVQKVNATIHVEEREWRPRWLQWTSLFADVRKTVQVNFDQEVGERSGSYKGGVYGCGQEMKPGETPLQCLRRMEAERKFN